MNTTASIFDYVTMHSDSLRKFCQPCMPLGLEVVAATPRDPEVICSHRHMKILIEKSSLKS